MRQARGGYTPNAMPSPEPTGTRCLKRDPALVPLSRDHHFALMHALALTRSRGASAEKRRAVAEDFLAFYERELLGHMADEEEALVPATSQIAAEDVCRLVAEHHGLRERAAHLRQTLAEDGEVEALLPDLGVLLHDHVRFEERVFFERVQERLTPAALAEVGRAIEAHRAARGRMADCALPPAHLAKTKTD
jgi:hypothetical protein